MRWNCRQTGFTLIEVILVLAITSALIAGIFAGQSALIARSNFQQDVEKVTGDLKGLQTQAISTVNGSGTGGSTTKQVFGVEAVFSSASTIQVNTLLADATSASLISVPITTISMRSLSFSSPHQQAIIFTRSPDYVYVAPIGFESAPTGSTGDVLNPSNYFRENILFAPKLTDCTMPPQPFCSNIFPFTQSGYGYRANITVDTQTNAISRIFK